MQTGNRFLFSLRALRARTSRRLNVRDGSYANLTTARPAHLSQCGILEQLERTTRLLRGFDWRLGGERRSLPAVTRDGARAKDRIGRTGSHKPLPCDAPRIFSRQSSPRLEQPLSKSVIIVQSHNQSLLLRECAWIRSLRGPAPCPPFSNPPAPLMTTTQRVNSRPHPTIKEERLLGRERNQGPVRCA